MQQARKRALDNSITKELGTDRQQDLLLIASLWAITFQGASSQTEGRNGYLAFINHAHKEFSKDKLKVLTVIHNFDIKIKDGTTPANRLFIKYFPTYLTSFALTWQALKCQEKENQPFDHQFFTTLDG